MYTTWHPLGANQNYLLVPLGVRPALRLKVLPPLAFGVDVQYIPHVDTAPHPIAPAMVVANVGTGNSFARRHQQMWYLMWNRISPVSLNPLTSSHMIYSKSRFHQRVSLLTLTLALLLPNHHLPNTSDSRLTRDAPVILHMSQIWTILSQSRWTRLLFVSLTNPRPSSQPQDKPHSSALTKENLCSPNTGRSKSSFL